MDKYLKVPCDITQKLRVKKDLSIDKLKNWEYKLEDIIENTCIDRVLGIYNNMDL